jgi:hypothetical protein
MVVSSEIHDPIPGKETLLPTDQDAKAGKQSRSNIL